MHLSIGAPFGVLEFFGGGGNPSLNTYARSLFAVIFWPIILSVWLGRRVSSKIPAKKQIGDRTSNHELDILIESAAQTLDRETRLIFEDYVALSLTALQARSGSFVGYEDLLRLSGHARPSAGAACLLRMRNDHLIRLLGRARSDMVGVIVDDNRAANCEILEEVFKRLGDIAIARQIRSAHRRTKTPESAAPHAVAVSN